MESVSRGRALLMGGVLLSVLAAACAPRPGTRSGAPLPAPVQLAEEPAAPGPWRPHLLRRCRQEGADRASPAAERALAECDQLYRAREGSDAIMVLELALRESGRDPLVLLGLGQLYLLAGQGEPDLLPREGPAADVRDWARNRSRLLGRAAELLQEAGISRVDDSSIDYLLADVARARGDTATANRLFRVGRRKCSLPRSLEILRRYQDLGLHPARVEEAVVPDYPQAALQKQIAGEVLLDLLIDPFGRVAQVETVASPSNLLTRAAAAAWRQTRFQPARVGKYPVWSWLRVPSRFTLTEAGS